MWERYVAVGDSTTEGLDDPDGDGGYRGWANRLAEQVAAAQPTPLLYANLAVRGRRAAQVRDEQLGPALALQPDLATVVAGLNDVLRPQFAVAEVASAVEDMLDALTSAGATVLTFTMPDPSRVMPAARRLVPRLAALNAALRESVRRTGALLVDLEAHPVASDPRLWSTDRLHANGTGHARIAAALAAALELPGSDASWAEPLPTAPPRRRHEVIAAELAWTRRHLIPWVVRHARGQSSGDGREPKRPVLLPVEVPPAA